MPEWVLCNEEGKDQMGHHSIKVTVDIYGHLVPRVPTRRRWIDST